MDGTYASGFVLVVGEAQFDLVKPVAESRAAVQGFIGVVEPGDLENLGGRR